MKKLLFTLLVTVTCYCQAREKKSQQAQEVSEPESKLIIGIHAAPSGAMWLGNKSLRKDYGLKYYPKLGYSAGISLQYNIKPKFALAVETNYERKGDMDVAPYTVDDFGNSGTGKQNEKLDYITVPILAKFKLNKKKMALYVNAGVYAGYLIKYSYSVFFNGIHTLNENGDISRLNRFDYGLVTSIGYSIAIKQHFQFSFELRNNLGLALVVKGSTYDNEHPYNESFALQCGIAYKLKK